MDVYDNTVYDCSSRSTAGGGTTQGAFSAIGSPNVQYVNNIIDQPSADLGYFSSDSDMARSPDRITCASVTTPVIQRSRRIASVPTRCSWVCPNHDFQLQSSSPAVDTGIATTLGTADIDGSARPQGAAYDIGAYEFLSGAPSPTPTPTPTPTPSPTPTPTPIPTPTPTPTPIPTPTPSPTPTPTPTPTPVPGGTPVTVNFDLPSPSGSLDSLLSGSFGGINFGSNRWRWGGSYAGDTTDIPI